jgi:hypothetical protein
LLAASLMASNARAVAMRTFTMRRPTKASIGSAALVQ